MNEYVVVGSWISVMGICVGIGLYLMTLNLLAGAVLFTLGVGMFGALLMYGLLSACPSCLLLRRP